MLTSSVHRFALSIDNFKTIVTFLADSDLGIEFLTILLNLAAYSIGVEVEALWAFRAESIGPGLTPKIIVNDSEEIGIRNLFACSQIFNTHLISIFWGLGEHSRQQKEW